MEKYHHLARTNDNSTHARWKIHLNKRRRHLHLKRWNDEFIWFIFSNRVENWIDRCLVVTPMRLLLLSRRMLLQLFLKQKFACKYSFHLLNTWIICNQSCPHWTIYFVIFLFFVYFGIIGISTITFLLNHITFLLKYGGWHCSRFYFCVAKRYDC